MNNNTTSTLNLEFEKLISSIIEQQVTKNSQQNYIGNGNDGAINRDSVQMKKEDGEGEGEGEGEGVEGEREDQDGSKIEESNVYKKAWLQFYKAILLMNEVMTPIQSDNLLSLSEQPQAQFQFLMWSRIYNSFKNCKTMLSFIHKPIPHNSQLSNIDAYLQKSLSKHTIHSKNLSQLLKKPSKIIQKIFIPQDKHKYIFLDGFEGIDYTAEEQVRFIHDRYVGLVLSSKEIKSQTFVDHRFKKILRGLRKIWDIRVHGRSQREILAAVNQLIADQ